MIRALQNKIQNMQGKRKTGGGKTEPTGQTQSTWPEKGMAAF